MSRHDPTSLTLRSVTVDRAGRPVLHNVSLTVPHQARMAVVGPNGVGKSTLLAVMAGRIVPTAGSVETHPPGARIGVLDQELTRSKTLTGRDLVARRIGVAEARAEFEAATAALAKEAGRAGGVENAGGTGRGEDTGGPKEGGDTGGAKEGGRTGGSSDGGFARRAAERYDRALTAWEQAGGFDFDHRLDAAAQELGLEVEALDRATATLSGGQLTKVGLASIMVSNFDVTLLDEPTNNLDRHGLALLTDWVLSLDRPLVMVSHDRRFLEQTVTSVARIVANGFDPVLGNLDVFTGSWSEYQEQLAVARRQAEERHEQYSAERARLQKLAQQKREWADRGTSRARNNPADNDRNRYQYDMAGADKQIGAAKAVVRRLDKLEATTGAAAAKPWQPWQLRLTIAEADRGSGEVIVARDLVLRRGPESSGQAGGGEGRRAITDQVAFVLGPLSLAVHWGERILIDGPNGSGKTTLLDGLLGRLEPAAGSVTIGPSIIVGEIGQQRQTFGGTDSLLPAFATESGLDYTESRSLLAKFGLDAAAVGRTADTLSPGQRTRAELALFQARGVNLIVLDEPTNHLDMEAIEQLEQALGTFGGTLLVVSHDQRFREALDMTGSLDLSGRPAT